MSLDSAAWEEKFVLCGCELKGREGPWAGEAVIEPLWESEENKCSCVVVLCRCAYCLRVFLCIYLWTGFYSSAVPADGSGPCNCICYTDSPVVVHDGRSSWKNLLCLCRSSDTAVMRWQLLLLQYCFKYRFIVVIISFLQWKLDKWPETCMIGNGAHSCQMIHCVKWCLMHLAPPGRLQVAGWLHNNSHMIG